MLSCLTQQFVLILFYPKKTTNICVHMHYLIGSQSKLLTLKSILGLKNAFFLALIDVNVSYFVLKELQKEYI